MLREQEIKWDSAQNGNYYYKIYKHYYINKRNNYYIMSVNKTSCQLL